MAVLILDIVLLILGEGSAFDTKCTEITARWGAWTSHNQSSARIWDRTRNNPGSTT